MRLSHPASVMEMAFDDDRLVGYAGLVPVMRLAEDLYPPGRVVGRGDEVVARVAGASGEVLVLATAVRRKRTSRIGGACLRYSD